MYPWGLGLLLYPWGLGLLFHLGFHGWRFGCCPWFLGGWGQADWKCPASEQFQQITALILFRQSAYVCPVILQWVQYGGLSWGWYLGGLGGGLAGLWVYSGFACWVLSAGSGCCMLPTILLIVFVTSFKNGSIHCGLVSGSNMFSAPLCMVSWCSRFKSCSFSRAETSAECIVVGWLDNTRALSCGRSPLT